jgi:hypothetical protein
MRPRHLTPPLLLVGLVLFALPPSADAKHKHKHKPAKPKVTSTLASFGSLGSAATVAEAHSTDTAFWMTSAAISLKGQVRDVQMRGCAESGAGGQTPLTEFHLQVLMPDATGATVTATSEALNMPVCGSGTDASTVSTWSPQSLCVMPGEVVAFVDSGGFSAAGFPQGVPYEIFGADTTASTEFDVADGPHYTASTLPSVAMLMQVQVGTGTNARPFCR